ncbi:MAG: glyoxalase/bleomycin resistance/dioxygenase family protein [Acidobacteriaceae bacterium]
MPTVIGVSAVILYSQNPAELARWYSTYFNFRMEQTEEYFHAAVPVAEPGKSLGSVFIHLGIVPAKTKLAGVDRPVMLNFKVADLEQALVDLGAHGIRAEERMQLGYGAFAYIKDLEGNPIELWQELKQPQSGTQSLNVV